MFHINLTLLCPYCMTCSLDNIYNLQMRRDVSVVLSVARYGDPCFDAALEVFKRYRSSSCPQKVIFIFFVIPMVYESAKDWLIVHFR